MAIEKDIGAKGDEPSKDVEAAEIDVLTLPEKPGIQEMADGSVLIGEIEEQVEMAPVSFDSNLADYIDDAELGRVSSDLVSDIEEDMSSRKEWEDT